MVTKPSQVPLFVMDAHSLVPVEPKASVGSFRPGDTVRVSVRIVEGERERTQTLQGVVVGKRGSGPSSSFTIRRISYNVGVEHTFSLYSPRLERVEVIQHGKVRRARLYYLRGLSGRAARIKERRPEAASGSKP